jgi:hypothetical protein
MRAETAKRLNEHWAFRREARQRAAVERAAAKALRLQREAARRAALEVEKAANDLRAKAPIKVQPIFRNPIEVRNAEDARNAELSPEPVANVSSVESSVLNDALSANSLSAVEHFEQTHAHLRQPSKSRLRSVAPRRGASPLSALRLGTAVGLFGMMLVIGYANRRPASPVGLGELTRSTTVTQKAPFGAAEVKPASMQASAETPAIPTLKHQVTAKPAPPSSKRQVRRVDNEPEVVVRHYNEAPKPAARRMTHPDDGVKRFSDLD